MKNYGSRNIWKKLYLLAILEIVEFLENFPPQVETSEPKFNLEFLSIRIDLVVIWLIQIRNSFHFLINPPI